jgi:hypothetical protein
VSQSIEEIGETASEREALLGVFGALMRPLMPVALEYGLSAKEVSDVVRRVYVRALEARLASQSRPPTDARLALMSGLTRSEVSAFRDSQRGAAAAGRHSAAQLDQIASLLSTWHTHPRFSGAYGLALDLDLVPDAASNRRSFSELVEVACPNADREGILDELVAIGSAEVIDGTTIRCRSRAYVWRSAEVNDATRIDRTARFLEAAAASFAHNLRQDVPGYFERTLVSDVPLSEKGRDDFARLAKEKGEEFILELDTSVSKLVDPEGTRGGKHYGVGVFFFEDQRPENGMPRQESRQSREVAAGKPAYPEEIDVLAPPPPRTK